jgi:1,4-dihydroxy-2-naphthoyl-CoA synthase
MYTFELKNVSFHFHRGKEGKDPEVYEQKQNTPVIAFFHGYCIRAGFALALACDFRLAADNLEIGIIE